MQTVFTSGYDEYIHIEINTGYGKDVYVKSFEYFTTIFLAISVFSCHMLRFSLSWISPEVISEITGLSLKEINDLK